MGARKKLNEVYFLGSLVLAAIAGGISESFLIFWLALIFLVAAQVYSGAIRPTSRPR